MPRAPKSSSVSSAHNSLRRNQACHRCRRRKLKCDAQKPCSACVRSQTLATNAGEDPEAIECTYDDALAQIEELKAEVERLQSRNKELEATLSHKDAGSSFPFAGTPSTTSDTPGRGGPDHALGNLAQSASSPENAWAGGVMGGTSQDTPHDSPDPLLELLYPAWPTRLPPPPLLDHLVEVFITSHPYAPYLLHRPTFAYRVSLGPTSLQFPSTALLHAICSIASLYSTYIPSLPEAVAKPPTKAIFLSKDRHHNECFGTQQAEFSREAAAAEVATGEKLFELFQSVLVRTWWAQAMSRWVDLWTGSGMAIRYAVPLGLNTSEGYQCLGAKDHLSDFFPPPANNFEAEQRIQSFWLVYSFERTIAPTGKYAFSIDDEDVSQIFPTKLANYESGILPSEPRQVMFTPKYLTVHPPQHTDSFGLYVKATTLLSKIKVFNGRYRRRYGSDAVDPRDTAEFKKLDSLISAFYHSFPKEFRSPFLTDFPRTGKKLDVPLYVTHTMMHYAVIALHELHADFSSKNCQSVEKLVTAARSTLDLVHLVCTSSFSLHLLDPILAFYWFMAVKILAKLMKSKLAHGLLDDAHAIMSEISVVKLALLQIGERLPMGNRQAEMIDDFLAAEMAPSESEWGCLPRGLSTAQVHEVAEPASSYRDLLTGHGVTVAEFLPEDGLHFDQKLPGAFGAR
ncbi:hypothetical protein BOTBODRAFT_37156 [Botryobasidium botryosum FD-172 SS1]|uniref:Zn(2)-C6 fungal-type domain-containing protein n=1 Tax=Botryobasidium botryosum (strain FD-172 SS1) TaxID=930990 RepID=A0A067M0I6_BOTB1|nr:hypothetical protein BOTBODRAFT_37156 [Botryobasidium botryosum FD-172 SS1]